MLKESVALLWKAGGSMKLLDFVLAGLGSSQKFGNRQANAIIIHEILLKACTGKQLVINLIYKETPWRNSSMGLSMNWSSSGAASN
jgi:hypothetical protein